MRRRSDVIWREVDGKVVGLDLRSSQYFSLNASASRLWALLGETADHDELVETLVACYDVDRERAVADVDQFVKDLVDNGLVET
ncbi:MAG: PqqD family protein [Acidimicrobiales bacterium]